MFRRKSKPEQDDRDETIQALGEIIAAAMHWNEHTLGTHSPYLGSQLNSILTNTPIEFGFQFQKDGDA